MVTRSSHNWVNQSGTWDALKTRFIDFEQYPIIGNPYILPEDLQQTKANALKTITGKSLVDMFVDDYRLEKFWNRVEYYLGYLREAAYVMTPDFSLLVGMPIEMMQWNVYRNRLLGYVYEREGMKVIPTVSWAGEESYKFCCKGIREGSTIAVSNVGARNNDQISTFIKGLEYVMRTVKPPQIVIASNKKHKALFTGKEFYHIEPFWEVKRKQLNLINHG